MGHSWRRQLMQVDGQRWERFHLNHVFLQLRQKKEGQHGFAIGVFTYERLPEAILIFVKTEILCNIYRISTAYQCTLP